MIEILNKDEIKITRNEKNKYVTEIDIREGKLDVRKLFQFDKLYILKELNADIIEKLEVSNSTSDCATILVLYKHFFKELGFSKFGIFLNVVKNENENFIEFTALNNLSIVNENTDYTVLPIETMVIQILKKNDNSTKIILDTFINVSFEIPPSIEKLVLQFVHKIFTRIKQFIEN